MTVLELSGPLRDAAVLNAVVGPVAVWSRNDKLVIGPLDEVETGRLRHYLASYGIETDVVENTDETTVQRIEYTARWAELDPALARRTAEEIMAHQGRFTGPELHARLPMLETRASSRVRGASTPPPKGAMEQPDRTSINAHETRASYMNFFALTEVDMAFPRYDGSLSETVTRAALVGGDAVTVLPYDPVRDCVLIIEQFRFGPYMREDPRPWLLEPIAGRIDPGETPEDAVHREAMEEAGLRFSRLESISNYYPSPGTLTEYLYTYVGIADLPDTAARVGGLETEAEDIKGRVMAFERLMALVASGEANNGPLILSAYWLGLNRDRLRGSV